VSDQIGSPTSAKLIAEVSADCLKKTVQARQQGDFTSGLYHLTADEHTSWYGFAKEIIQSESDKRQLKMSADDVNAITTSEYPTPARRPLNSRLDLKRLKAEFDIDMPDWKQVLSECLEELSD
jgi:dTDP-4-dehydrorhamnose reductase